jgi:hypothetical protein
MTEHVWRSMIRDSLILISMLREVHRKLKKKGGGG